MRTQKRHHYLLNIWQSSYPKMPKDTVFGRLSLSESGFGLDYNSGFKEISNWESHKMDGQSILAVDVLIEGDLIAIKNDEVLLLAPNLDNQAFFGTEKKEVLDEFNSFLKLVRRFFESKGFLEIPTPSLVSSPGSEEFLYAFKTELEGVGESKKMFLPTSPEFHLKKALSAGFTHVFEISKCFRNRESGLIHQAEFHMLEFYRAFDDLDAVLEDSLSLINFLIDKLDKKAPKEIKHLTVKELFKKFCGIELSPTSDSSDLLPYFKSQSLDFSSNDSFDDLFFRLFISEIEPNLKEMGLVVIKDYPPSQAALARLNEQGWADRFELYWKGLELANAFHELNDPAEQLRRLHQTNSKRVDNKEEEFPIDEEFIRALKRGMPPSGGIALGLERLFMCLYDLKDIKSTRLFPIT
ncbi:MAG: EF-P lysine aminoacylase EpmA [Bdellovibrionales bacterium]